MPSMKQSITIQDILRKTYPYNCFMMNSVSTFAKRYCLYLSVYLKSRPEEVSITAV